MNLFSFSLPCSITYTGLFIGGTVGTYLATSFWSWLALLFVNPALFAVPAIAAQPEPGRAIINEVAWMGTHASATDEWIELFNPGDAAVDLNGWTLRWNERQVRLRGEIPAKGYFLLERTDDSTVADVEADLIYTGSLRNGGEILQLFDRDESLVDSANADGGAWPAGHNVNKTAMQRIDPSLPDSDGNWQTFSEGPQSAHDASGNPIQGSPGTGNERQRPETTKPEAINVVSTPETSSSTAQPSVAADSSQWIWVSVAAGILALAVMVWRAFIR